MKKINLPKSFLCLLVFIFSISAIQAQKINGRVTDEKGSPIPFASIRLVKSADTTLTSTTLADLTGRFAFNSPLAGNYFLRITAIGFTENKVPGIEVSGDSFSKDFGTLILKQDVTALNNVTVEAMRPTITQKPDRLVVSVEGTVMAAGSNAFAVLSKSPGVFVDPEGNIQLNGRAGVTIMIDNRPTYLSARELRSMLEAMPAENLKNIEIITNPSAKYEAEGTSGILNINLKKNTFQGINGSIYNNYSYNFKQYGGAIGGNINFKSGKWNSFLNLDMNRRVGGREATFTRIFYGNQTTYFDQVATGNFVVQGPPSVRLGTDYSINDKHTIGGLVNFVTNRAEQDFLTETWIGSTPKQYNSFVDADNLSSNRYFNFTTNLHYVGKFDSAGTQLSTDIDYVKVWNRGYADYYNAYTNLLTNQKTKDILHQYTPNGFNIYSGRIDFSLPVKKQKFETGVRASQIDSDFDFRFYFNNNGLVLDPRRSNHFKYNERILAAYLNWSGPLGKNLTLQTGLRVENTHSVGNSLTINVVTKRDYTNLFPSVFLQQKVSENYGINYSYSRRLTRPNYNSLNPFRAYRDPYTWFEGNTTLRPQYIHAFSIAQSIKKTYTVTINYQVNKDAMAEIPLLLVNDTTTVYTTGNVNDGWSTGLTGIAPIKITKKWDTQNTIVFNYSKFSLNTMNGLFENDQLFFMLQSNHTILLPKDLKAELNFLYRGPSASGLYEMAAMSRVDFAIRKSLLKKKLELAVNVNDIFKGYRFIWEANINGNINDFNQYFRFRQLGFSARWNFSKGQKVNESRRNAVEEVNRL